MIDPKGFNRPARQILPETSVDRLGLAIVALTRELWIVKDRQLVLEAILAKHGIDAKSEIEAFVPDAAISAELEASGSDLINHIIDALSDSEK